MTADLRFEPFGAAHVDAVAGLLSDRDIMRFTLIPDPPPPDFATQWLVRYEEGRRDGTREAFVALDGDGVLLGLALAPHIDRDAREVELGYMVAPAARGRGVATEMLRRLTDWAFAQAEAVRVELVVDAVNAPSLRVAERCGYVREGVLRSKHFKQGARIDTVILSRLATDP